MSDDGNLSDVATDDYEETSTDLEYEEDFYVDQETVRAVGLFLSPVLLFVGIIGNMTSLWVINRLFVHSATTCLYLILLSITDTLILLTRSGNDWAKQVFDFDVNGWIRVKSEVLCQVYWFACNFLLHLCSWLLVFLCLSSASNHSSGPHRDSLDRAKHYVLVLILVLICSNAHYFWTIGLYWPNPQERNFYYCTYIPQTGQLSESFRDVIWPLLDIFLSLLAPNLFIVCCLCVRCVTKRRRSRRNALHPSNIFVIQRSNHDNHRPTVAQEFSRVAVFLSVCGVIFTSPEAGYNFFEFLVEQCEQLKELSGRWISERMRAQVLSSTVRDVFLSSKFCSYLLLSPAFRKVIFERILELFRKTRHQNQKLTHRSSIYLLK